MKFVYDEKLKEYMEKSGKKIIAVEVASSNCSDIEITELYVHFVSEKQAEYFKAKKKFREYETEMGKVLLPNYRLDYEDIITFGLKSFWFIKSVTQKGIRV